MSPPQVNLNEKPILILDLVPEKESLSEVVVDQTQLVSHNLLLTQRRRRSLCLINLCFVAGAVCVLLLCGAIAFHVYYNRHHEEVTTVEFDSFCQTSEGDRVPQRVKVDHKNQLISVTRNSTKPGVNTFDILHEYNRMLLAFYNASAGACYIDKLEGTLQVGIFHWKKYQYVDYFHNHTLRVVEPPIDIEVVQHFADVHIVEHCGGLKVKYHWVIQMKEYDDELQFYVMYRDQEAKYRIHTGIERISITSSKNGTISVYVTGITSL